MYNEKYDGTKGYEREVQEGTPSYYHVVSQSKERTIGGYRGNCRNRMRKWKESFPSANQRGQWK